MAGGRPKGAKDEKPWTAALRLALNEYGPDKKTKKLRLVAEACVDAAIAQDGSAIREIGERLDGKVAQAQVIQGDDKKPLRQIVEHTFKSGI